MQELSVATAVAGRMATSGLAGTFSAFRHGVHAMSKKPPVPPASRSPKARGSAVSQPDPSSASGNNDAKPEKAPKNLREQGQSGNIAQNTRNQGYQQDR
jgi:hypothetical protein